MEDKSRQSGLVYFDSHIHMSARTTDDYENMYEAGIRGIIEPAFWLGQPRTGLSSFQDYYSSLIGWERFRASQFGIKHYCTIGLNSKEANNVALAEQVMEILPLYLTKEGVVGVGEIGFDEQSPAEERFYREQIELAKEMNLPIQIHTPHRDKVKGTQRSMDILEEHGINPAWAVIDHNNENTVAEVLDRGYWTAFTIYPKTKMGSQRMVDIVKKYGSERIIIDSSADWGISDPLSVPKTAGLMLSQEVSQEDVHKVAFQNAIDAYGKSGKLNAADFVDSIDQTNLFEGNSILRGQSPRVDEV